MAVRWWRPAQTNAQVILLHGVVSHSDWLKPIAERLAKNNIEVICPDRRGVGLNTESPGDAEDAHSLIEDVAAIRLKYARAGTPVHIAGFCWGATYAICCIEKYPDAFRSLIMIAPSVFPASDIANADIVAGESSEPTEKPLVPIDRFTSGPAYENYIVPDRLRTTAVSPRFNAVMIKMTTMLAPRWVRLRIPSLMVLASDDRLADIAKHEKAFEISKAALKRKITISGEHGLQFDDPERTAQAMLEWLIYSGNHGE